MPCMSFTSLNDRKTQEVELNVTRIEHSLPKVLLFLLPERAAGGLGGEVRTPNIILVVFCCSVLQRRGHFKEHVCICLIWVTLKVPLFTLVTAVREVVKMRQFIRFPSRSVCWFPL